MFDELTDKVVKEVALKVQEVITESILDNVYSAGTPSVYERTGEFATSFDIRMIEKGVAEVFYEPVATYNPDKAQHGIQGRDRRQALADMLENNISDIGEGWWTNREPFFSNALERIDEQFDEWVKTALINAGVSLA